MDSHRDVLDDVVADVMLEWNTREFAAAEVELERLQTIALTSIFASEAVTKKN